MKRLLWLLICLVVLSACTQQTPLTNPEETPLFTDQDVSAAGLNVATQTLELVGNDSRETATNRVLGSNAQTTQLQPMIVFGGYLYYLRNVTTSTTRPWRVYRINMITRVTDLIYSGQRRVQTIGGSSDGNVIVLSMKETTDETSDFEIFRFIINTASTQQLTANTEDDTNVSATASGLRIVWQKPVPVSGLSRIFIRTFTDLTPTSTFIQSTLLSEFSQRMAYVSGNGNYLALVRDIPGSPSQLLRYDINSRTYLGFVTRNGYEIAFPSVSNSGERIIYNEVRLARQIGIIQSQTIAGGEPVRARDIISSSSRPTITGDGNSFVYIIGGLSGGRVCLDSSCTKITNPTTGIYDVDAVWQQPVE